MERGCNQLCQCTPSIFEPGKTFCGFSDRQTGSTFPCDLKCCPKCSGAQPPSMNAIKPTTAATLPQGFGTAMTFGEGDSEFSWAFPFKSVEPPKKLVADPGTYSTAVDIERYPLVFSATPYKELDA